MDRVMLRCLCCAKAYTNITAKTTFNPIFLLLVKCPSLLLRNKAKNALSLAKTISPVLAEAKIGKFLFR